jgi:hypothetical protein
LFSRRRLQLIFFESPWSMPDSSSCWIVADEIPSTLKTDRRWMRVERLAGGGADANKALSAGSSLHRMNCVPRQARIRAGSRHLKVRAPTTTFGQTRADWSGRRSKVLTERFAADPGIASYHRLLLAAGDALHHPPKALSSVPDTRRAAWRSR